ncbi:MAG: hypothetical protein WEB03_00210 [Nitriliruptor sp.]|uniref:hypothetical protein n=1 Tax=Nitriliruptor sp. TaxID=2448056 RepID=UPI00349FF59B
MVAPWDRRSDDDRARIEAATLARWLPGAVTAAPFHAARVGDIDDRLIVDRRGLQRLAPTRERDLLADGAGGGSAVLRPNEQQVKATADDSVIVGIARAIRRDGTGGKRDALVREYRPLQLHRGGVAGELLVASTRSDLDRQHRVGARAAAVLGLREDDVLVSALPAGPTLDHLGVVHLATGAALTALHARGVGDDLTTVAAAAARLPVTVLVVAAHEADVLAAVLREERTELRELRTVVSVGPPPTAQQRAATIDAFRRAGADREVAILALWGPSVSRSLWAECVEGGGGLHTYPDLEVLEVLDPLTGRVTDGDGDLTLTSAGWHGTVHLRFQTGTWVDPLTTDPCPGCGRDVPRLVGDLVPHAWELPVALDGGVRGTIDLRGIAAVVARTSWVTAWRAELRGPDERVPRDRLVVELAGTGPRSDTGRLERALEAATGLAPEVIAGVHEDEVVRGIDAAGGVLADRR